MTKRKTLGEHLVEANKISKEQLNQALAVAQKGNDKLGNVLVRLGFATEDDICKILSEQLGFPYVKLTEEIPENEALALISAEIAQNLQVFPLKCKDDTLVVAMADPLNIDIIDNLSELSDKAIEPVIAAPSAIQLQISKYFYAESQVSLASGASQTSVFSPTDPTNYSEGLVREGLAVIVKEAVQRGARFVHLEPSLRGYDYRFRVQGSLSPKGLVTPQVANFLEYFFRSAADIDFNKQYAQSGRVLWHIEEKETFINIKTLPTLNGQYITLQISGSLIRDFRIENLGLMDEQRDALESVLSEFAGVTLVSGTNYFEQIELIYALLNRLKTEEKHIVTLEDPILNKIDGIFQSQVNYEQSYDLSKALQSVVQMDPDIVMVSRMSSKGIAELILNTASSGIKMVSTLLADKPVHVFSRMREMGIDPQLLALTLNGIIFQRTLRKLCDKCKQTFKPAEDELKQAGIGKNDLKKVDLYHEVGCPACHNSGYQGNIVVCEIIEINDALKEKISVSHDISVIKDALNKSEHITIKKAALHQLSQGLISLADFSRIFS